MCNSSQHNPDKQNLLWSVKQFKMAVTKPFCNFWPSLPFPHSSKAWKMFKPLVCSQRHLPKKELGSWKSTEHMRTENNRATIQKIWKRTYFCVTPRSNMGYLQHHQRIIGKPLNYLNVSTVEPWEPLECGYIFCVYFSLSLSVLYHLSHQTIT